MIIVVSRPAKSPSAPAASTRSDFRRQTLPQDEGTPVMMGIVTYQEKPQLSNARQHSGSVGGEGVRNRVGARLGI